MRIATVDSVWRYPVKSMRGQEMSEIFVGFPGVYGDRLYAFQSSLAGKAFPWFTGREQESMLLYKPRFRDPEKAHTPLNLAEAEAAGSGLTPVYADPADLAVEVETPTGELFAIDDPALMAMLRQHVRGNPELALLRSHRAMTDCRPVSLISIQSARGLGGEVGIELDKRRFRANIYLDLASDQPFGENDFVGKTLRIGEKVQVAVLQRDSRCKMITLDPDTAQMNPDVLRHLAKNHENNAGVYGAVLVEGTVRAGDVVSVLTSHES